MRLLFFPAVLLLVMCTPAGISAQIPDVSVCDVLASPKSFDGKMVRIKATVFAGFEEFVVQGNDCKQSVNSIWLTYPEGTKGKAGPVALLTLQLAANNSAAATPRATSTVSVDANKDFKEFDKLLSTAAKSSGLCLGCVRYVVAATLIGRLDADSGTGFARDASGRISGLQGFGHLNAYPARLVLQSVSEVTSREIEYSKPAQPPEIGVGSGAPIPGNLTGDSLKRGADAFGAPGEDNGVNVGFGVGNEVRGDDQLKSASKSPDGLIFNALFDSDRLKGNLLQLALAHLGTHIADIRSPRVDLATLPLYGSEFRAWQTLVLGAISAKTKLLTSPGGFVIYNQSWPEAELSKNANAAIAGFLEERAGIRNPIK